MEEVEEEQDQGQAISHHDRSMTEKVICIESAAMGIQFSQD